MELNELVAGMRNISLKRLKEICCQAEVPYSTALKVRGGFTKNPRFETMKKLEPHIAVELEKQ